MLDETDENINFALEKIKKQSGQDLAQINTSNMDEVQIRAIAQEVTNTNQNKQPNFENSMGGTSVVFD